MTDPQDELARLRAEVVKLQSSRSPLGSESFHSLEWALERLAERQATDQARYRSMLDSTTDYAIIIMDVEGVITDWNEGARRILGWECEEVRGLSADLIFTPEDCAAGVPEQEMLGARENGCAEDDRWHLRKGGERFFATGMMMPLLVEGQEQGFVKILRDRTRQREEAERRARMDERLKAALAASPGLTTFELDLSSGVLRGDKRFWQLHRLSASDEQEQSLTRFLGAVHEADRVHVQGALENARNDGAAVAIDYRVPQPARLPRWITLQGRPTFDDEGRSTRLPGTALDITRRKTRELWAAALVELSDRLGRARHTSEMTQALGEILGRTFELTRAGYGTIDQAAGTLTIDRDWTSQGVAGLAGSYQFEDYGLPLNQLAAGQPVVMDDIESDPHTAGHAERFRTLTIRALVNVPLLEHGRLVALIFLHDRNVRHWSDDKLAFLQEALRRTREAIERRRAEDARELLTGELHHRVKNMLAVVQAIATQTFQGEGVEDALDTFHARLTALGAANEALAQENWRKASLESVVLRACSAQVGAAGRIRSSGPQLVIKAQAVTAFSLALHELCTNAAKYGALRNPEGFVEVSWTAQDEQLQFSWIEVGVSDVTPPLRDGFGSKLIERSLVRQFGGKWNRDFEPTGLRVRFDLPLDRLIAD